VYSFKPETDTSWQTAPSLPQAVYGLAATTGADGTIYAIGGWGCTTDPIDSCGAQSTVYRFKPGTDTSWQTAPSLPAARWSLGAVTGADGTIYAIGGRDSAWNPQSSVYSLAPGATSWQAAPSLPAARMMLATTIGSDGTIYAIGGYGDGCAFCSTVYRFNPRTDTLPA
jgi:N-acetylneuraminic acid mutarotase